ncbi:tyrosine-type recombinase/integrase [Pseudomonas asplenii]|uniref:tyrosine-type recombinase/integrase n=1 Tax=Pseudomonas asplenii TaxID=53407 RepID=UPI00036E5153|nr:MULTISPECIES: integrase [Pseudomonas]UZE27274.1 integrase [Pseudomonas asplenii]
MAKEWGIFSGENPATGVRKNKDKPRDFYASDEVWDAVYEKACFELRNSMDLAYLSGQQPADVLSFRENDASQEHLSVDQGKTGKKLTIRLMYGDELNGLGKLVERLLEHRRSVKARNPYLILTDDGRNVTKAMLRIRFDEARKQAIESAVEAGDQVLAATVKQFQFRDIRPKAASEIEDLGRASRLLGHTDKRITETAYRRVGEVVEPTR